MNNRIAKCENYREYFTAEYMMGPNSLRLLDELADGEPALEGCGRVLDLGCGMALTSAYLARETGAATVFAADLWIAASDNLRRIREWGLEDRIIPLHADALALPFADDYFDAIVSVDAFHYFGCADGVFAEKLLPLLRVGGSALICIPGIKQEPAGELAALMDEWAEEDAASFHTAAWWKEHIALGCEDAVEVEVREAACADLAWEEWFASGHEFAARDREFLARGLGELLCFVIIKATRTA